MRDFELASLALIVWVLLYDFTSVGSRADKINRVKNITYGDLHAFKVNSVINWTEIDFSDDWMAGYHIYSLGKVEQHEFRVVHTYDKNNRITFQLRDHSYFEICDEHNNKMTARLDRRDNRKVIFKLDNHTQTELLFEVN